MSDIIVDLLSCFFLVVFYFSWQDEGEDGEEEEDIGEEDEEDLDGEGLEDEEGEDEEGEGNASQN